MTLPLSSSPEVGDLVSSHPDWVDKQVGVSYLRFDVDEPYSDSIEWKRGEVAVVISVKSNWRKLLLPDATMGWANTSSIVVLNDKNFVI
jgi:hypothetical protein